MGAKKRRHISENFGAAGLSHLAAPYGILCGFSHNDLSTIALRHQGENGMTYRADVDPQVLLSVFAVAIDVMVRATNALPEIAQFPEGHFDRCSDAISDTWSNFVATNSSSVDQVS